MKNQVFVTPYFLDEPSPELESLAGENWILNKKLLPEGDTQQRIFTLYEQLANTVTSSIFGGLRPVSIAGDCCAVLGVVAGLQRSGLNPVLLWFDAHGDFNTWETTPSGFLGGMPLAMLVGRGEQRLLEFLRISPIDEQNVILVGGRDLDPGEKLAIEASNVIHLHNPLKLLDHLIPNRDLYVHFDVDILDPGEAPAVSFPAGGGSSTRELKIVFNFLKTHYRIVAASLSAWNPQLDLDGHTREVCLKTFRVLLE